MIRSRWNSRMKRIVIFTLLTLFLATVGSISYTAWQWKKMTQEWYQPIGEAEIAPANETGSYSAHGFSVPPFGGKSPTPDALYRQNRSLPPFTLLVIGVDSRDGEAARSDSMILATINPARQRAYLLSIPRDSFMELPKRGFDKVNHAMAFGGPAMVKKTLEHFFDIKIDRYVTVDFDGFRKVIDELGGVEVNIKKRMKYNDPTDDTDIDLYPGLQTLNGKQALDYARYRKSDIGREDSDYERIARQQEIIKAMANKGDSVGAFFKAFKLMEIMGRHMKTDLTEQEIASLLLTYYDPKENEISTETLAGADQRIWQNGIRGWYYLVPSKERQRVHKRIQEELALSQ